MRKNRRASCKTQKSTYNDSYFWIIFNGFTVGAHHVTKLKFTSVCVDWKSLDIAFHQGFNVITGEADGKSLLLDALSLCVGGRADSAMVRHGAAFADLYAEFEADYALIRQWFDVNERKFESPIVLRRKISEQGRSQAWINGMPAGLSELKSLGVLLVNIHSQHASLELLKPHFVIEWLDEVAGITQLSDEVKLAFHRYQALAGWAGAKHLTNERTHR